MTIRHCLLRFSSAVLATTLVLGSGASLRGQEAAEDMVRPHGFLVLVPMREMSDLLASATVAADDLERARRAEQVAVNLRSHARADVERMKQALAALEGRRTTARNSASAEAGTIGAELKALEREKDLLEERERLGSVEIDLARHSAELARLAHRSLDLERELLLKRIEQQEPGTEGPASSSRRRVLLDLEEQTLRAQIAHADKKIEVARREKQVIDRLLRILSAQRRVVVS